MNPRSRAQARISGSLDSLDRQTTNESLLYRPLEPPPPSRATGSYRPATSSVGQCDFPLFRSPRGVAQRLKNVLTLQVRVSGQHLIAGVACADQLDDCADRDTHGTYRGFATHEIRVVRNSVEVRHGATLPRFTVTKHSAFPTSPFPDKALSPKAC